jgi:hydrogenase maturation protein HypF
MSSSLGRLFDAVAAAVGLCRDHLSYEGQAAIELEALFDDEMLERAQPYPFELQQDALLQINPQPMWRGLLQDLHHPREPGYIAARFHQTVAYMMLAMAQKIRLSCNSDTVALSGGVMQNPSLLRLLRAQLEQHGFKVLIHRQVPSNDGGIALGQAAIAAARINSGEY